MTDRKRLYFTVLSAIGAAAFVAGFVYSYAARADELSPPATGASAATPQAKPRVIYPKRTDLDFEGLKLQGEIRSPGEFYFQHRNEEKFDSLVKRRKNFHQEMLRDAVLSK